MSHENGVWTADALALAEADGTRLKFLFFWGHTAPADGSIGPHVFSQWWESPFMVDEITYSSAEHFMMAGKARLFDDGEMLERILAAESPSEAKKLGRMVRGFDQQAWVEARLDIVTTGSIAKFDSTHELRGFLCGTGSCVLVEASPRDRIWGIGMGRNNENATVPSRWRGQNLLGIALMQARAVLSGRATQ